jgi:hypothetical protein
MAQQTAGSAYGSSNSEAFSSIGRDLQQHQQQQKGSRKQQRVYGREGAACSVVRMLVFPPEAAMAGTCSGSISSTGHMTTRASSSGS